MSLCFQRSSSPNVTQTNQRNGYFMSSFSALTNSKKQSKIPNSSSNHDADKFKDLNLPKVSPDELLSKLEENKKKPSGLVVVDIRENRLYQTSHIASAVSASCYTKTMAKRAIAKWPDWCPQESLKVCVVLYDQRNDTLIKEGGLLMLINFLTEKHYDVCLLNGGFESFKKIAPVKWIGSCLTPDAIQQYQTSQTNSEVSSEDVLNATASKVLPFLYLGNERDSQDIDLLEARKITHILNVTDDVKFHKEVNSKFKQYRLAATDCQEQNLIELFEKACQFIDEARYSNGIVLVHCWAGVSRSATIVLAYLMKNSQLNLFDSLDYLRGRRSVVAPNFNFMGQLERFYSELESGKVKREDTLTELIRSATVSSFSTTSSSGSEETPPSEKAIPFLK